MIASSPPDLPAIIAGVKRHLTRRDEAVNRLLRIVGFLARADRFHGVWPHFLDGSTGWRMPVFGMYDNGGDLVETAFLVLGLLAARQYFHAAGPAEQSLYSQITSLWESLEWDWYRRSPDLGALLWHWSPEYSWYINHRLTGWNEVMIVYFQAIASPTHGVPANLYYVAGPANRLRPSSTGRTGANNSGRSLPQRSHTIRHPLRRRRRKWWALFFTHYSYLGFDPRGLRDQYTNYFRNSRNIALINLAYYIRNPGHYTGYGPDCLGLTASDGPEGYMPHEATSRLGDETMTPTGAVSSFPYTPKASMLALRHLPRSERPHLGRVQISGCVQPD